MKRKQTSKVKVTNETLNGVRGRSSLTKFMSWYDRQEDRNGRPGGAPGAGAALLWALVVIMGMCMVIRLGSAGGGNGMVRGPVMGPARDPVGDATRGPVRDEVADDLFNDDRLVESAYPGGDSAWRAYLKKAMLYPAGAVAKDIEGTVIVDFVVDEDGRVREVAAIAGPVDGGLREQAVRVIREGGIWVPARDGRRRVRSHRRQPVVFRLK